MNKSKKAFSLLELSIVLIVISILTSIIIGSSFVINTAQLAAARNLTNSSVVNDISGLTLWLESTSLDSFDDEDIEDGDLVENWYDISPQNLNSYIATQSTSDSRPIYTKKAIGKLPGVNFDDTDDSLSISNFNANGYITIFVVGKFTDSDFIVEHGPNASSNDGFLFWGSNTNSAPGRVTRSSSSSITATTQWFGNEAAIGVMRYDDSNISYKLNDASFTNTANSSAANSIVQDSLYIGSRAGSNLFSNGSFGEIIMFDRDLTDDEVDDIVEYLNKKWQVY